MNLENSLDADLLRIPVYLEVGKKKTFAGALDWPGWCRSGRDEGAALQTLFEYGSRYALALEPARLKFKRPESVSAFQVIERLEGNATADFGAPAVAPSKDTDLLDAAELERFTLLLMACWTALDSAAARATGKQLSLRPRGGGRSLEEIIRHINEAEKAYIGRLSFLSQRTESSNRLEKLNPIHEAALYALAAAAKNAAPLKGPRGGARWTPRYFVRRAVWHVLDHAWEVEDRTSI
jgi:hypothetical protein